MTFRTNFPLAPLSYLADVRPSGVDKHIHPDETPVRLCNYTDIYYRERITSDIDFMAASATRTEMDRFTLAPGDVVMTKDSETADDIGIPALVSEELDGVLLGYHNTLMRPSAKLEPRFLFWFLSSRVAAAYWETKARGVTRVGLRTEDVAALPVPLPPLDTQRRIADMLDAETARIDTLIEKNERVLELLDLRFRSWVEHVTHRGLMADTPRTTHPVWGEHPSAWASTTLGRASVSMVDGPFGSSLTSAHYSDAGRRVVRLGNIGRGRFKDETRAYVSEEHYRALASHEVRSGDLVMAGLGDEASDAPVGRACVVPDQFGSGIVKADCYRIRLASHIDHGFAAWALSSQSQLAYAASKARGATRARLNLKLASDLPLPVPPLDEQKAIANEIGTQVSRLHALSGKVNRQQELLRTRRQALVAAAVTGEIEV